MSLNAAKTFNPEKIARVLHECGVRYVLIGGLAAALHGLAAPTYDMDITPDTTRLNLDRLSHALRKLDARIRVDGVSEGLPFSHDADSLATLSILNLTTKFGDFDVAFHPAGVSEFSAWDKGATEIPVLGVPVRVAALDDLIESKEAADRGKDHKVLPQLRELRHRKRLR